jgi:LssY C-terminus
MSPAGRKRGRRWLVIFAVAAFAYGVVAYALLPLLWRHYEHQQGLSLKPMITETAEGIPGDPLNVGLVGDEAEVHRIMLAAGWQPADAITLRSSIAIAGSVVLDRPYDAAPVSALFYEGRHQDFAFEKAIGGSADRRHHVRLWLVLANGDEGRSVWLGAATRDLGVGQPLHGPDHPSHCGGH